MSSTRLVHTAVLALLLAGIALPAQACRVPRPLPTREQAAAVQEPRFGLAGRVVAAFTKAAKSGSSAAADPVVLRCAPGVAASTRTVASAAEKRKTARGTTGIRKPAQRLAARLFLTKLALDRGDLDPGVFVGQLATDEDLGRTLAAAVVDRDITMVG